MDSLIACDDWEEGDGFQVGDGVVIECQRGRIGRGIKIGVCTDENFRRRAGVRIEVDELILDDGVVIDREVLLKGGCFQLGAGVRIGGGTTLHVTESLVLQPNGIIGENCDISGVDINVGRYMRMVPGARIGGGSAFEVHSRLRIGHFCHLSRNSFINTSRLVELGDEVGSGSVLYTHGAYQSALQGFPVTFGEIHIGDRSWLPGATVNPGVTIGKDCVIGVGAVVTRDIPDGALAVGVPARVIREHAFPKKLSTEQKHAIMTDLLGVFGEICQDRHRVSFATSDAGQMVIWLDNDTVIAYSFFATAKWAESFPKSAQRVICVAHAYEQWPEPGALLPGLTLIDLDTRKVAGKADYLSERLMNQLRRYGVRFRYSPERGEYIEW